MNTLDDHVVVMGDGRETTFGEWKNHVRLVVNVASRCGLSSQYEALEQLQKSYGERGFTVIGFPSNQFLQELGRDSAIAEYCSMTWGVTFPITARTRVNGKKKHPLYADLHKISDASGYSGRVRWNFEKFLLLPNGTSMRFSPTTKPDAPEIVTAIEKALSELGR